MKVSILLLVNIIFIKNKSDYYPIVKNNWEPEAIYNKLKYILKEKNYMTFEKDQENNDQFK